MFRVNKKVLVTSKARKRTTVLLGSHDTTLLREYIGYHGVWACLLSVYRHL